MRPAGPPSAASATTAASARPPLLELRDIRHRFGGVHALRGASFTLRSPGDVHALLGANGCGKSTMLRVATGQLRPDGGRILLDGQPVVFAGPRDALRRGIATVTQETTLAPDLSVAENVLMGRLPKRGPGPVDWRSASATVRRLLDSLALDLPVETPVRRLRPDQQQMVEIARALSARARILILDEATSALTDDEVSAVFQVIRGAGELGMATIVVTHRLDEIYELAGEVTVLRDGMTVATRALPATTRASLVTDMAGPDLPEQPVATASAAAPADTSGTRLRIASLWVEGRVEDVSLDLAPGEIVGLTGLTRAGTHEVLEAVFGAIRADGGRVVLDGRDITNAGITTTIRAGVGFVPADRKTQGALLRMSVRQNLSISSTAHHARWRRPSRRREAELVRAATATMSLRAAGADAPLASLSGGNQQKIVIGKWLVGSPRVLLLAEPTRGVDVRAKAQIHGLVRSAAASGTAVLFASSELEEVRQLADRVVVMFRGRVVADLARAEASDQLVTSFMAGSANRGERDE